MSRTPEYSAQADRALDELEAGADPRLLDAVADAIDLILDHGDDAPARRDVVSGRDGSSWFKVTVRDPRHSWVVFWRPEGDIARIVYIGSFPER